MSTTTTEREYEEEPARRQDAPLALRDERPMERSAPPQRPAQGPRPAPVESRVRQTPEANELMMAFALAQMEFPTITKNKTATITGQRSYTYRYADLADAQSAVNPVLFKHGLAFMTIPTRGVLVGRLIHQPTGQWIEGDLGIVPPDTRGGVQALGSALTYERRYLFAAMLNLVLDEDDDGGEATDAARAAGGGYGRGR